MTTPYSTAVNSMLDDVVSPGPLPRPLASSRPSPIWLRISALLILVISAVLIIVSFLNYSNYRKNFLQLNLSRYLVVANDLRQTVEAGLDVGLDPAANGRLLPTMQELSKQQSGTRYIAILHSHGDIIRQGDIPPNVAGDWEARMRNVETYWQANRPDSLEIVMPIRNNFNLKIAAVVIGYDRVAIEDAMAAMRRKLILETLQVLVAAVLVIIVGVKIITRQLGADMASIGQVIDRVLTDADPPLLPENDMDPTLVEDINMFANLSHRTLRALRPEGEQ
jgi:sensor histidine kinase regulating citrate/malate metabolism